MVKYFLTTDKDNKWRGFIIDDSEGTIGQSRQITRFREKVEPAILQLGNKLEKFLFRRNDRESELRAAKFRNELNKILRKNHFEVFTMTPTVDLDTLTTLGIEFEFESTEE
jgi:hypothetical protein